jgi:hypothetical protein
MGSLGASCFNTLSDQSRDIEKAEWDAERLDMVCTKAEYFANWKAAILKLCKKTKICSYEVMRALRIADLGFERVEGLRVDRVQ